MLPFVARGRSRRASKQGTGVRSWGCSEAGDRLWPGLARCLCCCLLLGLAAGVHAGPLAELLERARVDDPTYRAAQLQAEGAAEALAQARALWLPGVSVSTSVGANRQDVRKSPGQGLYRTGQVDYDAREYGLVLSQALLNAGHSVAGEQAQARIQQVESELKAQQQDLLYRVAERYLLAVASFEACRAIQSEVDALSRHLGEIRRRREAGVVRRLDQLEAESRLGESEARRVEAEIRYADALRALFEVSGFQPARLGLLDERQELLRPEPADPVYWTALAATDNPLTQARRHALVVAELEVARQDSVRSPTLDLALRSGRTYASDSLYGGASDVANHEIRLNLNVPLYDGGASASRAREAAKAAERAAEELRAQQRSVERAVLATLDRIRGAGARVTALTQSESLMAQGLAAKRTALANGLATVLAVINAERDLASVRGELARARYDSLLGWLGLRRAAGVLAESDLQSVDAMLEREIPVVFPGQ